MEPDDLVITADIPLVARIVAKGGVALDPWGEVYTKENIGERLSMRDLMMAAWSSWSREDRSSLASPTGSASLHPCAGC